MDALRHFRLRRRSSHEEGRSRSFQKIPDLEPDGFDRCTSALAFYRPHQLSEIAEVSGSSTTSLLRRHSTHCIQTTDGAVDKEETISKSHPHGQKDVFTSSEAAEIADENVAHPATPRSDLRSLAPSAFSLPIHEIPQRRSSTSALSLYLSEPRHASNRDLQSEDLKAHGIRISRGNGDSPVRHLLEKDAWSSELTRAPPSRTFIRTTMPFYLLDPTSTRNPRLEMSVRLPAPLFVGGGTVEGQVELKIDATSSKKLRSKALYISRLSVDIIGIEEVEDGRRRIFLSLATELFNVQHPPPSTMVFSQTPESGSELYWETVPSTTSIPFCLNLPLKLGPPAYSSRQASIRYLLCPSVVIKIGEKRSAIRQAWSIHMLTVHNPERALASLPSPLLATDTLVLDYAPVIRSVKLTAGLHRQTWVSGGGIFIDIHITNSTDKTLKRIELQLEKSVLWFQHSAAGTVEKQASNLRLPSRIDTNVVGKAIIKKSKEWQGVIPEASEVRTCELDTPRGHVTIGDGRYFEVRYFVKVAVEVARNKLLSVKLPVTIIHINSLDIVPNSVAQVAASIEAKRAMAIIAASEGNAQQSLLQGQAFSAARLHSLRRANSSADTRNKEFMNALEHEVDQSPRRVAMAKKYGLGPKLNASQRGKENARLGPISCPRHMAVCSTCYHCHLVQSEHAAKLARQYGPKLPRLQVSTSGLGFSESEFEVPQDPPRKVMLSEQERQMINQEHELKLQRQWVQESRHCVAQEKAGSFVGWKNVAAVPHAETVPVNLSEAGQQPIRQFSRRKNPGARSQRHSLPPVVSRVRSRTNPETMRASFSDNGQPDKILVRPSQGMRSLERRNEFRMPGYDLSENDVFGPGKP